MHFIHTHPFILSFLDRTLGSLYIVSFLTLRFVSSVVNLTWPATHFAPVHVRGFARLSSHLGQGRCRGFLLTITCLIDACGLNGGGGHRRGDHLGHRAQWKAQPRAGA
jgi:hypothetical protein